MEEASYSQQVAARMRTFTYLNWMAMPYNVKHQLWVMLLAESKKNGEDWVHQHNP